MAHLNTQLLYLDYKYRLRVYIYLRQFKANPTNKYPAERCLQFYQR